MLSIDIAVDVPETIPVTTIVVGDLPNHCSHFPPEWSVSWAPTPPLLP